MKLRLFLISIVLATNTNCSNTENESFYELINQSFLLIADTSAYSTGRLIQIPNDTNRTPDLHKICIQIDTAFNDFSQVRESALVSIRDENLTEYEELLMKDTSSELKLIDISQIKNHGKYTLVKSNLPNSLLCEVIAGKISFFSPIFSQNLAIMAFSISDSPKAGYTNCWLFKKTNGKWKNFKRIELERW